MRILSIETSCDETALALVEAKGGLIKPQFKVFHNFISSQVAIHAPFGGVVPNLAKREHIRNLPILLKKIQADSLKPKTKNQKPKLFENIDAIAVTVGPGLEPALWTGIEFAKKLSADLKKPLIGANHMEGHLYSSWLSPTRIQDQSSKIKNQNTNVKFPAIALVVSGGHTILLAMQSLTKWKKLGETRDDAAGESFDKVARMLSLPYPGGPEISKLAKKGDSEKIAFPQPMKHEKNYDFSFSGIKTSVLYYLRDNPGVKKEDVAASFEKAVTDVLTFKTKRAAEAYGAKSLILCGGVAANELLRKKMKVTADELGAEFFAPVSEFNTDNAAMIAAAAYIGTLRKKKYRITAQGNLNL